MTKTQISKTCPSCSDTFTVKPSGAKRIYCSNACFGIAKRGIPKPHLAKEWATKSCAACGIDFQVVPAREATAKYCSRDCANQGRVGQPGTPGNPSGLRGKPTLPPVDKTCRACGAVFQVPYKARGRVYCSRACTYAGQVGGPRKDKIDRLRKCPVCMQDFELPPAARWNQVCCSRTCAGVLSRRPASSDIRLMTDVEAAWLAGLFDGEGTVNINNRRRSSATYKISIVNTFKPIMDRVIEVIGIGDLKTHEHANLNHSTSYTWHAFGADAVEILRQMRPWLIVKAERADAAMAGEWFPRQARWDDIYPQE